MYKLAILIIDFISIQLDVKYLSIEKDAICILFLHIINLNN